MAHQDPSSPSGRSRPPQRALLDAIVFSSGSYLGLVLRAGMVLGLRVMVSPAVFGAMSFTQGIHSYVSSYNGLYRNAIDREVPTRRARGELEEAETILSVSYTLLMASVLIEGVIFVAVGFFVETFFLRLAFWTVAVLGVFDGLAATDRITLKATIRFRALTTAQLLVTAVQASLMLGLAWAWGATGYFVGVVATAIMRAGVYRMFLGAGWFGYFSRTLPKRIVRQILSVGVAYTFFGLSLRALVTVDRFFVLAFLSLTDLGYYSLGIMALEALHRLTTSLAGTYFPRMMGLIGRGELEAAARAARKLQASLVLTMVVSFGSLAVVVKPLVTLVLPDYTLALPVLQVMVIGGYLFGAQAVAQQIHVGCGRFSRATAISVAATTVAALLCWALVGQGLVGLAAATAIAVGVSTLGLNWSSQRLIGARGLVLWMAVGLWLLATVEGLLYLFGWGAAALSLVAIALGSFVYLTRLLSIRWREMPGMLATYLGRRQRRAGSSS